MGDEGKRQWLETVQGPQGSKEQLQASAQRFESLGKALGAEVRDFKGDWHFATGLGLSHPVENGMTWHHTLGVPYLPASSVKGLLRGWVEAWMEHASETERNTLINRWFGAVKGANDAETDAAGGLIFFDALPLAPVHLASDVMTPHMGKWYEQGGEIRSERDFADKAPADWHSPVPVPFLVVKKPEFRFMIAPRLTGNAASDTQARQDTTAAMQQLTLALEWMGAGAKTAAGYGRFFNEEDLKSKKLHESGIATGGEVWENAKVSWNIGKSAMTILSAAGDKLSLTLPKSKETLETLSETAQKRLKDGKKHLVVKATVEKLGNQYSLISLTELPPS
ncbi:type III-B CRISPR module RAMP protein Cmr6 [Chitinilyticum piscinae]|uniref:Type III-B CRISPR module RAMP protein Cmr6 n=1 Tax=Chitinilyticum piscinae TaxID=2866724 RepID=A0A8J7G3N3_9NEIS|nr:type III-B CRISPR module RAMP protein Cmr6 [Chitinilyticum piscinae]MBE9610823.1 type III-B CRISPR module RAMP protein Cmr6 [Chitinilyticum piscinae]